MTVVCHDNCVQRQLCVTTECVTTACVTTKCVTTECVTTMCVTTECVTTECVTTECITTECVTTMCETTEYVTTMCVTTEYVTTMCVTTVTRVTIYLVKYCYVLHSHRFIVTFLFINNGWDYSFSDSDCLYIGELCSPTGGSWQLTCIVYLAVAIKSYSYNEL